MRLASSYKVRLPFLFRRIARTQFLHSWRSRLVDLPSQAFCFGLACGYGLEIRMRLGLIWIRKSPILRRGLLV